MLQRDRRGATASTSRSVSIAATRALRLSALALALASRENTTPRSARTSCTRLASSWMLASSAAMMSRTTCQDRAPIATARMVSIATDCTLQASTLDARSRTTASMAQHVCTPCAPNTCRLPPCSSRQRVHAPTPHRAPALCCSHLLDQTGEPPLPLVHAPLLIHSLVHALTRFRSRSPRADHAKRDSRLPSPPSRNACWSETPMLLLSVLWLVPSHDQGSIALALTKEVCDC